MTFCMKFQESCKKIPKNAKPEIWYLLFMLYNQHCIIKKQLDFELYKKGNKSLHRKLTFSKGKYHQAFFNVIMTNI